MIKKILILFLFIFSTAYAFAQDSEDKGVLQKYRRSALATMMVHHPEDEFGKDIKDAYVEIPIPDKYDGHDMNIKVLENSWFNGTQKKRTDFTKLCMVKYSRLKR